MRVLRSLAMAFTCFSRIPMPHVRWEQESMRYMMCFFPFIGAGMGLLVGLWLWACDALLLNGTLRAAGVTLIPLLVTGGIHVDGFCDVVDAQASHAEPEKKRAILKDPHVGSFAIVGFGVYLLCYFAFASELGDGWQVPVLLGGVYVVERCLSSIATLVFPKSSRGGMLAAEGATERKGLSLAFVGVVLALAAVAMLWAGPGAALAALVAAALCLVGTRCFAMRQYGGMSGDLAGFFLQVAELAMLACLVLVPKFALLVL